MSAIAENQGVFFEPVEESPFMPWLCPLSRLQTVSQDVNPLYHVLIVKFDDETGAPPLVHAGFNLAGEAVVQSPVNAIHCFFFTGLDALAPGSNLVRKT